MDAEKAEKAGDEWTGDSHLSDVELELNDDLDSVLLSEIELGNSAKEGMSTIIGKMTEDAAADADLPPAAAAKAAPPPVSTGDSGITLAGDSGITLGDQSDIKLAGDSTIPLGGGMDSDVKLISGSDLGQKPGSSDKLFGSDALKLSDDELSLVDSGAGSSVSPSKPSDSKKTAGSSIKLGDEELEVVLGGSDVTQSPTDSGIQLISASDSGLSLDQPLALGSSAKRLLDVDDATKQLDSPDAATEIKADDDFLLTAMDDAIAEESSDSGSQVIALDADDEISSGMFAPLAGGAGLLEEEPSGAPSMADSGAAVLASAPSLAPASGMLAAAPAEAPFSAMNVTFLAACALLLMFCGMLTFDLMRNMWSWDGPYSVNSSIMESLGNTVGWFEK
jgi:hypothetical protein